MLPDGTDVAQYSAPIKGSAPPPSAYENTERRRVRFNPLLNVLILFFPTSSPMDAPHSFYVFSEPNREYFDIPIYRGGRVRMARESNKKSCLLHDTEGGWVIVSRNDFDGAPAPAKIVVDASTQTEIES